MISIATPPIYGVFLRWPADGDEWIHPEDVELAKGLIPGPRIFRREYESGEYSTLVYGDVRLRVRPVMWVVVEPEGFEVGDEVEIRSLLGKNLPGLAVIREMHWDPHAGTIQYQLEQNGMRLEKPFTSADLQHVEFLRPVGDEPA